jgi:glycosyltransferase involved in cell wall biosynthesis
MGKKILLSAYAVSPTRGSEYSVAWNYIYEMSKDNTLVVLYGVSGNHMGDIEEMDKWLKLNSISNVRFVPVLPNTLTAKLNLLNKIGIFHYAFYFAFRLWQLQVYDVAKKLIKDEHFDLIHFLNPIGYREPGYLWKIDIPYIWGPISGTSNRPNQLFKALSYKKKLLFEIRNWVNTFQFKYNHRLKNALFRTDLLLTATTENQIRIQKYYNKSSIYLPENSIVSHSIQNSVRQINLASGDITNILWIGRIDSNKQLNILLDALAKINTNNWQLHVIGDGPKKTATQKLSMKLNISSKISWYGHIPRTEVFNLLQNGHLHIITSLSEANTTVLWEAMAYGIPTISLNHCGMKDVICEKCGVKIDISSYRQVINDLANVLSDLLNNPSKINELSKGVNKCASNFTWEKRRELFNQFYQIAIENWQQKKTK